MTATEIERRKPVWSALSEFYLDTELSKDEISRIAKVFSDSKFSMEELKEINYSEVGPVVFTNLYSTAGAWNGFDEEWLYEQITERLNKKKGEGLIAKMFRPLYRKQIDKACGDYLKAVTTEMKNHMV
jgi:hypothetical protein